MGSDASRHSECRERGLSDGVGSCYGITQFWSFSRQIYISSCELIPFNSLLLCELTVFNGKVNTKLTCLL